MVEKTKRTHAEALIVAQDLVRRLKDACHRIEIAGSLRRRKREVGDIELVAIPKILVLEDEQAADMFGQKAEPNRRKVSALWAAVDSFVGDGYSKKGEKYRQFTYSDMQVDLFTATAETWGWIFLVRTGSAEFSRACAIQLNQSGYTSEDGQIIERYMKRKIATPEESDVFRLMHRAFTNPEERR